MYLNHYLCYKKCLKCHQKFHFISRSLLSLLLLLLLCGGGAETLCIPVLPLHSYIITSWTDWLSSVYWSRHRGSLVCASVAPSLPHLFCCNFFRELHSYQLISCQSCMSKSTCICLHKCTCVVSIFFTNEIFNNDFYTSWIVTCTAYCAIILYTIYFPF